MSKIISKINKKKSPGASSVVFPLKDKNKDFVFAKHNLMLYRLVYSSKVSICVVLLLLISFFVQGAQDVYANETDTSPGEETVVLNETVDTPVVSVDESVEAINTKDIILPTAGEVTDVDVEISPSSTVETNSATSSLQDLQINIEEAFSSTTLANEDNETNEGGITDDSNDLNNDNQISGVTGSSSEDVVLDPQEESLLGVELTHETVSVTESDSQFTFSKEECTQLATGSFYCLKPQENILQDALFSAPDSDGDLEIYLVRGGEQVQVTNNHMDDAAPYFDSNTNTLVWHRLIDDRFQVISYDISTGKEEQITKTPENNMEPTRQGKYTVWQRWVDGGWNIVLLEGSTETQLTHGTNNNVAPFVHGNLIVWNKHDLTGEKTIEMYDTESSTYVTVDDPDGMSVSNPRMVFVYDSLHPNGDIVTKGYDVLSRKFIELGTLPRDLPEELPKADSTGETRALIQSKPSVKSNDVVSSSGTTTPTATTSSASVTPLATSTADIMTIDMTLPATTTSEIMPQSTAADTIDIIIEPLVLLEVNGVQE